MAQWIRHLTTNQGIPGSSPGRIGSFDLPKMTPSEAKTQGAGIYETLLDATKTQVHIISAGNIASRTQKDDICLPFKDIPIS